MKIGKFSGDKAGSAFGQAAGVIGGALLSNGAASAIPLDNKTAAKAIVAAVGVAGMIFVSGNDTAAKIVRGVSLGMAAQQGKELIKEVATPMLPSGNGTVTKFINDSFKNSGTLVASSETKTYALGRGKRRGRMGSPELFAMANPGMGESYVEGKFQVV